MTGRGGKVNRWRQSVESSSEMHGPGGEERSGWRQGQSKIITTEAAIVTLTPVLSSLRFNSDSTDTETCRWEPSVRSGPGYCGLVRILQFAVLTLLLFYVAAAP